MGNYFEDVYLKRMNIDGKTRQERVKTKKEKEFNRLYLQKTEYQAFVLGLNDEPYEQLCSLQPNKWNERNYISNLLIPVSARSFKTGDVLRIRQKIKEELRDNLWIVIFVEENLAKGYKLFKLVCLEHTINIADEYGTTIQTIPCKITNGSAIFNADTFIHSATQLGYREPFSNRIVLTKDLSFLKKGQYFEYKGRGWEIASIDTLSIDGVAYMTISEKLKEEPEPLSSSEIVVGKDENFFLNGR